MVSSAVLGETGVQYDIDKFIFLGSPYSSTHYFFLTRKEMGLTNLEKLRSAQGVRVGAQSVGHTIYNIGRLFAWLLPLKDPKFISGLFDAGARRRFPRRGTRRARHHRRSSGAQSRLDTANKIDLHALMEIPRGNKYPRFGHLPDIETFAKSDRERKVLAMFRNLRLTGSPFFVIATNSRRPDRSAQAGDEQEPH